MLEEEAGFEAIIDCNIHRYWIVTDRLSSSSLSQKFRKMKKKKKNIPEQSLHNRTRLTGIIYVLSGVDDIELLFQRGKDSFDFAKHLASFEKEKKINNLFQKIISGVNCYKSPPLDDT